MIDCRHMSSRDEGDKDDEDEDKVEKEKEEEEKDDNGAPRQTMNYCWLLAYC